MWSDIVQLEVIEDDSDMLHFKQLSYNSDYKKCKFKSTNTRHVEMNRIAKRQMQKSPKGITMAKKKDLLMPCKTRLTPRQHNAFFNSPTVTTSGRKKDDDSNSDSDSEEDESSDTQ